MKTTTRTTVVCDLDNGSTVTLTANDCAGILNALARRHMLVTLVEEMPEGMGDCGTTECCAWAVGGPDDEDADRDEEVVLSVNAGEFQWATPRQKPKAKPAKRKRKSAR